MSTADSDWMLRNELARRTGTRAEDWFLVFKARYGMEVVFRSLARSMPADRRSVLTQLYTCCTAVDPIIEAGLTPRYVDIDPDTLSLDREGLSRAVEKQTPAAVVLQHTFGIMDGKEAQDRVGFLRRAVPDALVVEDCAHCVGSMSTDGDGSPLADVSIFSFGVEKILPDTRFGGAVWVSPRMDRRGVAGLRKGIVSGLSTLPVPSRRLQKATRSFIMQNRILSHLPAGMGAWGRRILLDRGLYEPAISALERRGKLQYQPLGSTDWINQRALDDLRGLEGNREVRRRDVSAYWRTVAPLARAGKVFVPAYAIASDQGTVLPLLRFPVVVRDSALSDRIVSQVRSRTGVFADRWYRPLLLPGVDDPQAYGMPSEDDLKSMYPQTWRISQGIVTFPTDVEEGKAVDAMRVLLAALS